MRNFRVSGWQCLKSWQGDKIPLMLLVLLAKQKNEEGPLFWQRTAEKTSPPPSAGGQARRSLGGI